jgi:type IV pilus assembly protein PilN
LRHTIHINLASEPFRHDRPFLVAAITGVIALLLLLGAQVGYTYIARNEATDARLKYESNANRLQTLASEKAALENTLRLPANSAALQYSYFLNDILRRKGISWTQLFSDMDNVMPYSVRLIDVRPQVNRTNTIQLNMTVASQTPGPVVEMLKKLEGSKLFGSAELTNSQPPGPNDPVWRFRITCNYAPKL